MKNPIKYNREARATVDQERAAADASQTKHAGELAMQRLAFKPKHLSEAERLSAPLNPIEREKASRNVYQAQLLADIALRESEAPNSQRLVDAQADREAMTMFRGLIDHGYINQGNDVEYVRKGMNEGERLNHIIAEYTQLTAENFPEVATDAEYKDHVEDMGGLVNIAANGEVHATDDLQSNQSVLRQLLRTREMLTAFDDNPQLVREHGLEAANPQREGTAWILSEQACIMPQDQALQVQQMVLPEYAHF